jgi:hypothetical protein
MSFSGEIIFQYFKVQFIECTGTVNLKVAAEALRGSIGMFFKVLTSTRNGSGLPTIRSGGFTPGQGTRYPLHSILGELQGRSGRVRRRENSLPSQGFKSRTICPVANQYIIPTYAIPAIQLAWT